MALHLLPEIPKPESKRKIAKRPVDLIQCPRCHGREVLETTIGAKLESGKLKGGTKQILCATCFFKGERVVLG